MVSRDWSRTYYREDLGNVSGRSFANALISECRIEKLSRARFENCDLRGTEIAASSLDDLLGVTLTLDCFTFKGLRMSSFSFKSMLYLMTMTEGNDEERADLRRVIGPALCARFDRQFEVLGRT